MSTAALRSSDVYATVDGVEYHASVGGDEWVSLLVDAESRPDGFVASSRPGRWIRQVTLDEVERLETVTVHCRWREHNFQISDIQGDEALVDYLDHDWTWSGVGRIERPEPGVAIARLPLDELVDVQETRKDQLAWRREHVRKVRERGY